jgi:histidinol-phosphatase (PHP family)
VDFEVIERLREANPEVQIRAGIELDNDPVTGDAGRRWVKANWEHLDFVLGSVHYLQESAMFDSVGQERQFLNRDIDEIYQGYFQRIRKIASEGLIDCLSHLDLIKIHGHRPHEPIAGLVADTLAEIRKHNLAIELSTAGWRKPVAEQYPSVEIIRLAQAAGIPFTLASDAHSHAQLGEGYDRLATLVEACGIREVCVFERHRRQIVRL